MIEIPESVITGKQASETLKGKRIAHVIESNSPHRLMSYNGDLTEYSNGLVGRAVLDVQGYGVFVGILIDVDTHPPTGDGTNMRYYTSVEKASKKYQLAIVFEDDSFPVFMVSMYGPIYALKGEFDNPHYQGSIHKLCPLDERFDKAYPISLIWNLKKDISAKALLVTEQRISGLSNGVCQDILLNARIPPKRKISILSEEDIDRPSNTVKFTLEEMTCRGGRDMEKGLYGALGNYHTTLSKNTYHDPCPICGERIQKEVYPGDSVYYCPHCQREG